MSDERLVDTQTTFASFANILDQRVLRALADLGFARPTLVQAKAIPLALESRDILARARTGSGKTAAYCVPLVQKILNLNAKSVGTSRRAEAPATRALILVPTRELAEQVNGHLRKLLAYCEGEVSVINVASGNTAGLQRTLISDTHHIVIATPSRALAFLQSKALSLSALDSLVIDEADLILSYGHDEDVRGIFNGGYLPKVYQSFLMSATMTEDVEMLKGLALRNPAILKLEEDPAAANLTQYAVRCTQRDKFLLTYVILKLKLIHGKCIIFVNDVDRCYRLKLFLEQFSIKSCVLNSELPLNSRYHTVQEFNKGVYDYIIATDESGLGERDEEDIERETEAEAAGEEEAESSEDEAVENGDEAAEDAEEDDGFTSAQRTTSPAPKKRKRAATPPPASRKKAKPDPPSASSAASPPTKAKRPRASDREYGVTRGVDFLDVAAVLNFDLPGSARAYTHRVGRTARAGRAGMALSFVSRPDLSDKDPVNRTLGRRDEEVFARIEREQGAGAVKEYRFDMRQVEAFRYRMEDALRSVTRVAVREARVRELKAEVLGSEKLKAHFEDNPLDLEFLKHDRALHPQRVQPHMKFVPKYLIPGGVAAETAQATGEGSKGPGDVGFVPFKKDNGRGRGRGRGGGGRGGRGGRGGGAGKRKSDPLRKFGR
ncbi:DEAD-domain-containing protein [Schizophyllum commune H4-8]|uniref:DEAD-domain-containing protein n=1 Tax=Schizophyllum commune (strain H4-8 / FGSC 9210) TaxID=578458 RepID=UPI0021604114|nr:DEAD-domain-containing protein [Schizophyllum commune H4-8]KAI5894655.1 DEAD-domain-containing protein [Schizophyllum commune H4-8]